LVAAKIEIKLKKINRGKRRRRWDLGKLKSDVGMQNIFAANIDAQLSDSSWENKGLEEKWEELKVIVKECAVKNVGYVTKRAPEKPWVSEVTMTKMDERKKWKHQSTENANTLYKKLNNEIRRDIKSDKEKWWEERCSEIEELQRRGNTDKMYKEIKAVTGKGRKNIKCGWVRDKNGKVITEKEAVKDRWQQYVEELYDKAGKPERKDLGIEQEWEVDKDNMEPDLLIDEIKVAIKEMKNGKAKGYDEIPAEFWKLLGETALGKIEELCQDIYVKGRWPGNFTKSVLIPIPKKPNADECGDYRTISLIPHISKILLRILNKRIESKVQEYISRSQFGFRKGLGTRDAIGVLRMMMERSIDFDYEVYVCFVDFEKAFDRVN
jgi:hypothetical protein